MSVARPPISYSSMLARAPPPKPEVEIIVVVEEKKEEEKIVEINKIDKAIVPKTFNNIYSKWNTVRWLCHPIDDNFYNYDYCQKLFQMLMKWVRINGLEVRLPEYILFAKFMSLMYLISDKKCLKHLR